VRTRIGTQIIVGVGVVTAVTIGLMALLILGSHREQLVAELTRGAGRLAGTIKSSTHYDMLENRRESLHRQIRGIGAQPGIERIRLFNKEGQIMFSSDPAEIGRSVDKNAEACYACHAAGRPLEKLPSAARARIYQPSGKARILGIIEPIQNEPACASAACHAHSGAANVLGVLDVNVSLAEVDAEMAAAERRMVGLVLLTIGALSVLLWWLNRRLVILPARALLEGTRRLADGDLATRIPVRANHELGQLAVAFNEMTQKLADAQRQVVRADKLASVGRLAAGVAHEINNPLTGVLTYASFLAKRFESDPETKADLDVIVRETKRCREIVKGLLDFARQAPPLRQPTDLNAVIRHAVAVVMNQLALNRVELALELDKELPHVAADANQLEQVVMNLVLNAADSIGEQGGQIRIASRRNALPATPGGAGVVEVAIEDDGRGIRPEDLAHLFEPFFTTKGTRGTGLGLAVTWGIVEGHGGSIDVRSAPGEGACFTVRLPLDAVAQKTPAPAGA